MGIEPAFVVRGDDGIRFVHGFVFVAAGCIGQPRETDEAIPHWTKLDAIPYREMWQDDYLWIPHMLAGQRFDGRFLFDGDEMLDQDLRLLRD